MVRAADLRTARRSVGFSVLGLLFALSSVLVLAPRSLAAEGPYEPNETSLSAAGPLAIQQTYVASLETPSDRDFFFFYVTSASSQVTLTVKNLSGGTEVSYIGATIVDSSSTPVAAQGYINKGEERIVTAALKPQKYFVEIAPNEGHGDTYSITTSGSNGAFGPYSSIAGQCAAATAAVTAAQTGLGRAASKLQRATARVRRSQYSGRNARKSARAVYRRAKARVAAKKNARKAARASRTPWCFIPQ